MIKTINIKIKKIDDLLKFIIKANKINEDVLVKRGKFIVDAKSLLGVASINMSQGCIVEYPSHQKEFENFLKQFKI